MTLHERTDLDYLKKVLRGEIAKFKEKGDCFNWFESLEFKGDSLEIELNFESLGLYLSEGDLLKLNNYDVNFIQKFGYDFCEVFMALYGEKFRGLSEIVFYFKRVKFLEIVSDPFLTWGLIKVCGKEFDSENI